MNTQSILVNELLKNVANGSMTLNEAVIDAVKQEFYELGRAEQKEEDMRRILHKANQVKAEYGDDLNPFCKFAIYMVKQAAKSLEDEQHV